MTVVRHGTYDDCPGVARVQVAAWREAYAGIVPGQVLARLEVGERTRRWLALLERGTRLLVAESGGEIVGYASCGASRDEHALAGVAELYALYVEPRRWRAGIGGSLLAAAVAAARDDGATSMTLWVLEGNAVGRAFYAARGWRPDGAAREEQVEGGVLAECRYRLPV